MPVFDKKIFNAEAFGAYSQTIPDTTKTELLNSGAVRSNQEIYTLFQNQVNSYYGTIPYYGTLDGEPVNYDGQTDIEASNLKTYSRGVVAYGRAKAWVEKDFSYDITSGVDFMSQVAAQVVRYWNKIDQNTLLSVLKGVFAMADGENKKFVDAHTFDVSKEVKTAGKVAEDTLNNTIQQACGDNKSIFTLVIMHSQVATNLENLNLMKRWVYTDANGVSRELALGSWNGKVVLIDDSVPTAKANKIATEAEPDKYIPEGTAYTTYVLGLGAIEFGELPVMVPYEMDRDAKTAGGQTYLYTRKRNYIAPAGISYTKKSQASLSPTNEEFENGANWSLVNDGTDYISHKAIPIARIVSRG